MNINLTLIFTLSGQKGRAVAKDPISSQITLKERCVLECSMTFKTGALPAAIHSVIGFMPVL